MKILNIDFGKLFGTDPIEKNTKAFSRFGIDNPKPTDWFFAYQVDYQRADGARGTVGLYCHDIITAKDLFEAEFGDSALVTDIRYIDPDHTNLRHWLGDDYGQAPPKPKPASGEGMRSSGPDLKDETGHARANHRAFVDYAKRHDDPGSSCFKARYRMPSGSSGVIGILTQNADEAYELFTRRFGTRALVTDVEYIDPDHNGLSADNWLEP